MIKRIISIFLCLVLVLGLFTGCGASKEAENAEPVKASETAESVLADVHAKAAARRETILNSPTEIVKSDTFILGETYTGTAYYVSNSGSDSNSGTSPESPFATIEALRYVNLQCGDAIFFERGSVWRAVELPDEVRGTEGLTFSAYGEGPKPAFYGSEENGTGAENWELYYSDDSGRKIWTYYREMTEVASIVLGGEALVLRDIAFWDGEAFLEMNVYHMALTGESYDVSAHLPDMWCIPLIYYPPKAVENMGDAFFFTYGWGAAKEYHCGKLFFRCDEGNPGELYDDIEFIMPHGFCDGMADDQCYDNICLKYSSSTFTSGRSENMVACGGVVQNCEFAWMGGEVFSFAGGEEEGDTRVVLNRGLYGRNGGAVSVNGSNYVVRNNYVHNAFQEGIALETFIGDKNMENNHVYGNLIERTTQGILLCNWDKAVVDDHIFKNILIEDNIVLDSGVNNFYGTNSETEECNAIILQGGPCANKNLVIKNNVFTVSTGALVNINMFSEEYSKVFRDNVYVQSPGKIKISGITGMGNPKGICMNLGSFENVTSESISKYLGDETGKAYILE